jgi:hypothetical protein
MNRNTIIGIVIVVLIILGAWYFMSDKSSDTAMQGDNATTTSPVTETPVTPGSAAAETPATAAQTATFKSIFTQTGNHECKYEQVGSSTRTSSVIYIADGKMRGEFRTIGTTNSANLMVYSGGTLYSWKEGATTGKKTTIKSVADLPEAIPADLTSGAVYGTSANNVGWDCHDWSKDSKILTPPTSVTFTS